MNSKLIRPDYYDEEHILNEQEYKEFNFVRIDPYWKVRATAYDLTLNCFGTKEALIRRIDTHLYNRFMNKKMESAQAVKIASTDIEIIVKNLKCKSSRLDDITLKQLEDYSEKDESLYMPVKEEKSTNTSIAPWKVVPELSNMEKSYSYGDIYKGMAALMRPCMVFYNHFEESEYISGIVALPYTPKMLDYLNPLHVFNMIKAFGMKIHYDVPNIMDILSQKLLDLFYLVEDLPRIHGILPCQCSVRPCHNLASTYCANHMCKICCQDTQHRLPCIIHDRYEQFFRYKLKSVYLFEESQKFDRTRTLRLHCRRHLRKKDLMIAFEGLDIDFNNEKMYHHYGSHRLEYIYLTFATREQALKVLEHKHVYTLRLEKYDVRIHAMSKSLYSQTEKYGESNTVAVIKPLSTLEVAEELPSGEEYLEKLHQLIQMITRLSKNNYDIEVDQNPVTEGPDDRQVFIKLPNSDAADAMYRAQPLLGCLVVIKLNHIQFFSFLRYTPEICLMCSSKKDPKCIHDMCKDCCSRQMYGVAYCKCSQDIQFEKKNKSSNPNDKPCQKCENPTDQNCKNGLCFACCPIQAIRRDCPTHDESFYCRSLRQLKSPYLISRKMLLVVAECHLKVRNELRHGHYDWFRPVYGTNIQNEMIRANKDLQTFVDSGSIMRTANHRFRKDGKIFTFQANEPITTWISKNERIYESINHKGRPFVEYNFGNTKEPTSLAPVWVKNNPNRYRTYCYDDYEQYVKAPNILIKDTFHFMILGLDRGSFTIKELYQEIYNKMNTIVGPLKLTNIMILDIESLMTDIFNLQNFQTIANLHINLERLGRVACVKMDNILDAACLIAKFITITLPLNNGKIEQPIIIPSKYFSKAIEDPSLFTDFRTAGMLFRQTNAQIDTLHYNIETITRNPKQNSSNKKNNPNKRRKSFKDPQKLKKKNKTE